MPVTIELLEGDVLLRPAQNGVLVLERSTCGQYVTTWCYQDQEPGDAIARALDARIPELMGEVPPLWRRLPECPILVCAACGARATESGDACP